MNRNFLKNIYINIYIKGCSGLLLTALASGGVFAQEAAAPQLKPAENLLTLKEVLKLAAERNPQITAARKKWEAEAAKVPAAKSWPDPEVGIEFWGANETWYDVSQEIPFPGKQRLKGKRQSSVARREFENYRTEEKNIFEKVRTAYFSYFLAARQIEIFEESVRFLKHFAAVTESKYSVDEAPQANVLKAQLEYFKALNTLVLFTQERDTIRAELNALLNQNPETILGKPVQPKLRALDFTYQNLEAIALAGRPEIQAARQNVESAKTGVSSARADFIPDAMVQYSRRSFSNDMQDDNIVMLKFNVPLWFWKQASLLKAAKREKESAEAEVRSVESMTRFDLKSFLLKVEASRKLIQLYRTSVIPQAEIALKVSLSGYEAGTVGFLDLMDSERSWLEFQMEHYQYLAQYWIYLASLERLTGKDLIGWDTETEEIRNEKK